MNLIYRFTHILIISILTCLILFGNVNCPVFRFDNLQTVQAAEINTPKKFAPETDKQPIKTDNLIESPGKQFETSPLNQVAKTSQTINQTVKWLPGTVDYGLSLDFYFTFGRRLDQLDWNIAGNSNGENPNILSELQWNDLEIFQTKLCSRAEVPDIFYVRAYLSKGRILSGKNQDSDYLSDNRQDEFSRSNNSSDKGRVFDLSCGVGHRFSFQSGAISLIPLLGYSLHKQNLTIADGNQTITWAGGPSLGHFNGLNSTYDARWKGPWVGVDLQVISDRSQNFIQLAELIISLEYHWADYYAEADWNLRNDFAHPKSYEHEATGQGLMASMSCNLKFNNKWGLMLNWDYLNWSTASGTDRIFFSNSSTSETRLNEVNWSSTAIMSGISYKF